jgi:hypothetical protein
MRLLAIDAETRADRWDARAYPVFQRSCMLAGGAARCAMSWFRRNDRTNDLPGRLRRARNEAYLRGAQEAKIFRLTTGGVYQREQALDWLDNAIEDGRGELEAQHALEREVEAWDMSCRIMFWVMLA